jgi:ATP-dependent Lhr-like helicase
MRRATCIHAGSASFWVAAERLSSMQRLFPDGMLDPVIASFEGAGAADRETAAAELVRGWMESIGPVTAAELSERLALPRELVDVALARLEGGGEILRGRFTAQSGAETEWCNRRLLARIHRLTIGTLRKSIEPSSSADFLQFLFSWQHVAPGSQLHGVDGLLQILKQLQGYEISASSWETEVLPRRVMRYTPEMLDQLCLSGEIMWGRLSPHPAFAVTVESSPRGRRVRPTRVAPVAIFLRDDVSWLLQPSSHDDISLSHAAREVFDALTRCGASFLPELVKSTRRLASEVEDGLWELAAAGLVTADGYENLRALVDPRRRGSASRTRGRARHAAGRWALLAAPLASSVVERTRAFARQLLARWGIVFRDLLARETLAPPWRELLIELRRMEAKGEIRGGRFVSGFPGEQFARPEAVDVLRSIRRKSERNALRIAAADPLNLAGIIVPGARISPLAGQSVELRIA